MAVGRTGGAAARWRVVLLAYRAHAHPAAGRRSRTPRRGSAPLMITFVVFAAALTAAGVIGVGSVLLYLSWSNWSWRAAPAADSPQTMVARLARQLEADPQNLEGWLMLGRSYVVLQEFPLALRAFERADRLSGGKNVEALIGQAEALALQDPA